MAFAFHNGQVAFHNGHMAIEGVLWAPMYIVPCMSLHRTGHPAQAGEKPTKNQLQKQNQGNASMHPTGGLSPNHLPNQGDTAEASSGKPSQGSLSNNCV